MKKLGTITAALLLASLGWAQTAPSPQKPAAPPALAPVDPAAAPKVAKAPEAKTQEEFKAYQDVVAVADLAAAETAADEFAKKYPDSELRVAAYSRTLEKAYQTGDSKRIISLGRKVLAIEPDNAMTQVVTSSALAETTRETDLDSAEKYAEATRLSDEALKNIDTMLPQANVSPEQFDMLRSALRSMAYSTKGFIGMNKKDYAAGEQNYQKAIDANPRQQDAVMYLRLAVCQDNQRKYAAGYANAVKAVQLAEAQNSPQVLNLARAERDRLQKLMGTAPKAAAPAPPKQ